MLKFNKDFNVKIISLSIAVLFLFNSAVYGIDLPRNIPSDKLRPLFVARERLQRAVVEIAESTYSQDVISMAEGAGSPFVITEEGLTAGKELLYKFSELKHGVQDSIDYFAESLADTILKELGDEFRQNKNDWVICYPPSRVEHSGHLLAEAVSKKLGGIPLVSLQKIKAYTTYSKFEDLTLREAVAYGTMALTRPEDLKGKKILVIDDVFVSGTVLKEMIRVMTTEGVAIIRPFTAIRFKDVPFYMEEKLDGLFILDRETYSKYDFDAFCAHLATSGVITSKALKSIMNVFHDSIEEFERLMERLDISIRKRIVEEFKKYLIDDSEEMDRLVSAIEKIYEHNPGGPAENEASISLKDIMTDM